jgi:hypothetical protein
MFLNHTQAKVIWEIVVLESLHSWNIAMQFSSYAFGDAKMGTIVNFVRILVCKNKYKPTVGIEVECLALSAN